MWTVGNSDGIPSFSNVFFVISAMHVALAKSDEGVRYIVFAR